MESIEKRARVFKALGEPARLRIVEYLLKEGSCRCICEIADLIGRDQSVAFRHIGILRDAGLIETEKKGHFLMCRIEEPYKIKELIEV